MMPRLHRITQWTDIALPAVLDLYQSSFPANEQMRLSWWVHLLNELSLGHSTGEPERLLYAALGDTSNDVAGFAYCEAHTAQGISYLMYLATREDLRGQGMGAIVYRRILAELFHNKQTPIVLFEVEKPERAGEESPQAAEIARRRIDWYHRQGARVREGIRDVKSYVCQPPLEKNIMVHSETPILPGEAFSAAGALFGKNVEQIAALRWRPHP
jgi:ribosomal protein S18 acetylase RimI-like enzyme